jgi:hypothetical protein
MALIPWGSWGPDVSSYKGQHSEVISNVLPRGDGYGPVKALSAYADAMGAACRGAFLALNSDGSLVVFAGTATGLFKLSNTDLSWEDVTRAAGGAYAVGTDQQWSFAQAGLVVVAVNGTDVPQAYTLGTSTDFAALAGSPPTAKYVTIVANRVVLSGLSSNPYRIAWSAIDDPTGWTAGTSGSDVQDFLDGGIVRGVAGGEFGWVMQDNCIRRMTFVGGDFGFEFDRLTEGSGLQAPYSLIRASDRVLYLSHSGFEELLPNGAINKIGKEKFDRTFFRDWDASQPRMMIGAQDPQSTRVWWFYKSKSGLTGLVDKAIVYDYAIQRATPVSVTGEYAALLAQVPVTLDNLDALGFSNIDTMTTSLDDLSGSDLGFELAVFDTAHRFGFFSGANVEAVLETARNALDSQNRVFIRACRPDTDATDVRGSVFSRQKLSDAEVQSTESTMNAVGFTPHRVDCRIAGFRNRIPAGTTWTYSLGVEPELSVTGLR